MTRISTLLLMAAITLSASAWSSKGHQVVAYIAKRHLSQNAYDKINEILDDTSIVYYASWLDQVVNDPEYSYTSTWHYLNVDEGQAYEERASLAYTDAVAALYEQSEVLRNPNSPKEDKAFAIKVLTHVVGDIHQPMHAGHDSDKGGNYITVYYNGECTNLHHLFDYYMVYDAHDWSYYDWAQNIDNISDNEMAEIVAGDIDDWARESVAMAAQVYKEFPKYKRVTTADVVDWSPFIEDRLLHGGLRLATLLNNIFESANSSVSINSDKQAEKCYYNLQGRPVSTPKRGGLYIVKRGALITKEICR